MLTVRVDHIARAIRSMEVFWREALPHTFFVPLDFYWYVAPDEEADVASVPTTLLVGQLTHNWQDITRTLASPGGMIPDYLGWLGRMLCALSLAPLDAVLRLEPPWLEGNRAPTAPGQIDRELLSAALCLAAEYVERCSHPTLELSRPGFWSLTPKSSFNIFHSPGGDDFMWRMLQDDLKTLGELDDGSASFKRDASDALGTLLLRFKVEQSCYDALWLRGRSL